VSRHCCVDQIIKSQICIRHRFRTQL